MSRGSRSLPDVLRVGDPINAIPVHGFGGIWGTLALAVVAPAAALPTQSHLAQIGVPITGVASVLCRALATGALLFFVLRTLGVVRVPRDHEVTGPNVAEHRAHTDGLDTLGAMRRIVDDGGLTRRVEIEIGTEAGETPSSFDHVVDRLGSSMGMMGRVAEEPKAAADRVEDVGRSGQ